MFLATAAAIVLHGRRPGSHQTSYYPSFGGFLPLNLQNHKERGVLALNLEMQLAGYPSDTTGFIPALHIWLQPDRPLCLPITQG